MAIVEEIVIDISITYPLTKEAAEEIREPLLSVVLDMVKAVSETDDGYLLMFGRTPEVIQPLSHFIQVERVVSPFMRMALIIESNDGPVKLELSGPTGTKDFLYSEFALKRWF